MERIRHQCQCWVWANSGEDSVGGLFNDDGGTTTITNSTIGDNAALVDGGLFNFGTMIITNSTISRNVASDGAGGLFNSGTLTLQNTILARNISRDNPDCSGSITSLGNNFLGTTGGCTVTLLPSDQTGNPQLAEFTDVGTPGHGHFPPRPNSGAIDAGNDAVCPDTDQLGRGRVAVIAGAPQLCDIGAIEFQPGLDL